MDSSNTKPQTNPAKNLKALVSEFPLLPGVYCMFDVQSRVIYVGKAKRLRDRVLSYFSESSRSVKTQALMQHVVQIEVTLTANETEALLLEANLIKQFRPKYNVLLRDDKSYPYLSLGISHSYPRLDLHRGQRNKNSLYYGPYPSAVSVRDSLNLIQKLFKIRQCTDADFASRKRPCLQYQINRCTAPCVGFVSEEEYAQQIKLLRLFLEGKNDEVILALRQLMQQASDEKQYELAAECRDKITELRQVQHEQCMTVGSGELDIIGLVVKENVIVVSVLFVRGGRVLGQKLFYPKALESDDQERLMASFLVQYYSNPEHQGRLERVVINVKLNEKELVQKALQSLLGPKVLLIDRLHAKYRAWLTMVERNLLYGVGKKINDRANYQLKWGRLIEVLSLKEESGYVACFDISHTQGNSTVASCVVFDHEGAATDRYRRFNINGITPGDDYAAMKQAVTRYFSRLIKEDQQLPQVLLIDGGKGQLSQANDVMKELSTHGVLLVGVAKGEGRKSGLETLYFVDGRSPLNLPMDCPGFHLLQRIRDEAHRFAITAHRNKRSKQTIRSVLEDIPGVGGKRRKALLLYFGGFQGLQQASVKEIAKVDGISLSLAQKIHEHLHQDA